MAQQLTIWFPDSTLTEGEEFEALTVIAQLAADRFPGKTAYLVDEVTLEDTNTEKPYACAFCGDEFNTVDAVDEHMETRHPDTDANADMDAVPWFTEAVARDAAARIPKGHRSDILQRDLDFFGITD